MTLFCRLMSRLGFVHKSRYLVALRERDEARRTARTRREALVDVHAELSAALQERDDLSAELQSHRDEIARAKELEERSRDAARDRAEMWEEIREFWMSGSPATTAAFAIVPTVIAGARLDKSPYPAREELRRQAEMQKALRSL